MKGTVLTVIIILALTALACGASISLPKVPTPGPATTDQISVAPPDNAPARLTLSFGAGELVLNAGGEQLIEGTATYNIPDLKPKVLSQGTTVEIKQGGLLTLPSSEGIKNAWDFRLGNAPMDLTVNAGAYTGTFELGGLSLTGLTVKDGAATVNLAFTKPNLAEMSLFRYETGASTVRLTGLANANFGTMTFGGGAGDYTLDFSGALKRSATITVSTGLSNVILVIPAGTAANVTVESGLSNVSAGPGWIQKGNLYSQAGSGPVLTFLVKTGAGNVTITR